MQEQVDYLLNEPEFSDLKSEAHRRIADQAIEDIGQKMMRLEIARQRQDWSIPDQPTDGIDKVAPPETTDQFDDAVRQLAKARGKEEPTLPRPQNEDAPAHFQQEDQQVPEEEESPYEYDTQFPSSDGTRTYHVALDKAGRWSCECDGFRYSRKCKHLDTVKAWYDEQLRKAEDDDDDDDDGSSGAPSGSAPAIPNPPPASPVPNGAATQDPRVPPPQRPMNTPMPQGGVMIGGEAASDQPPQPRGPGTSKNPWKIPQAPVVKPGAQVTVKSKKKNE